MHNDMFRLAYAVKQSAETSDSAEIALYGEIIENTPEQWKWNKDDRSASEFGKEIKRLRGDGVKNLKIRINSPGGVCTESIAMRSIIANAGFDRIDIHIEGLCASAATNIATIKGAHVSIAKGSEYMIHDPWCIALGDANELEHICERLRNIEQMSRDFYAQRTGQSEEQIKQWMDSETWFTAEQAVEYGFADEVTDGAADGMRAVACATVKEKAVMREIYRAMPEDLIEDAAQQDEAAQAADNSVSTGEPETAEPAEIKEMGEESGMDIRELSAEQLNAENPELMAQIRQSAIEAERARVSDIEALTLPGYEEMAEEAKASGMSAMEFQKRIVSAMKQKGAEFMQARREETAPAQNVGGDAPQQRNEAQEISENAKAVAEYAKLYQNGGGEGMY